jgi:hypothetical protein
MRRLWIIVTLAALLAGCTEATPPPHVEVITLEGTPYERGFQHGQHFSGKIRSFYTKLLTTSLFPYLNRARPDISSVLSEYAKPRYDGVFSYLLMLENGLALAETLDPRFLQEMQGIADGAELPFEDILILNTFFDTLMGFRALTFFIRKIQAPTLQSVQFVGEHDADGVDNDDDGEVDEQDEGLVVPYDQTPFAIMAQVPTNAPLRIVLRDQALLGIPEGVDPAAHPGLRRRGGVATRGDGGAAGRGVPGRFGRFVPDECCRFRGGHRAATCASTHHACRALRFLDGG